MDTVIFNLSWLMFFSSASCILVIARHWAELPLITLLGVFGMGLTTLVAGFGMRTEDPCTPWQFAVRISVFGVSLLAMVAPYLLSMRDKPSH